MLRSIIAGLLLHGPLGALLQVGGCQPKSCEERAEQAYADCRGRCDPSGNACLEQCKNTFGVQLQDCGCVAVDISSTTPRVCDDPHTDETLLDRARQNTHYSKVASYLTSDPEGFSADEKVVATLLQDDTASLGSVLAASYTHPNDGSQTATLYYTEDKVDGESAEGFTLLYETGSLEYVLGIDFNSDQVQKEPVPEQQGIASVFSAGKDGKTSTAEADAAVSAQGLGSCTFICEEICSSPVQVACQPATWVT